MAQLGKGTFPEVAKMELGFRLSYEDLAEIMELLYTKFVFGGNEKEHAQVAEMRRRAHKAAFYNILTLAGWSEQEFEDITINNLSKNR